MSPVNKDKVFSYKFLKMNNKIQRVKQRKQKNKLVIINLNLNI